MNLLLKPPIVTAEELLCLPDEGDYELVDGRLVERQMGAQSSYIAGNVLRLLGNHCVNPFLGWVFPADASFQFMPQRPNLVRKPDVSFVRAGRFADDALPKGHIRLAPDLAVEVVSPNDAYYEVAEKLAEYRLAGVRLIWLVVPPTRIVQIRRLDGSLVEVGEEGELSGEDVIPGFRCSVRELFHTPTASTPTVQEPPSMPS
jgi:Uma2 family endonuclease